MTSPKPLGPEMPCLRCGKGWLYFTKRQPAENIADAELQVLTCNECAMYETRVVDASGKVIG
jgi:hypothetical protein